MDSTSLLKHVSISGFGTCRILFLICNPMTTQNTHIQRNKRTQTKKQTHQSVASSSTDVVPKPAPHHFVVSTGASDSEHEVVVAPKKPAHVDAPPSDLVPVPPPPILGQEVRVRPYYNRNGRVHNERWKVVCPNPDHPGCLKDRSVKLDQAKFGESGVRSFLATWLAAATSMAPVAHSSWVPTSVEVADYLREAPGPP